MPSTIKDTEADLAALKADIASLREDMAKLLSHTAAGMKRDASGAASALDDSVRELYREAAAKGEQSARAVGAQLEERPLLTLLIVAGVSYLAGRLLSR